MKTKTVNNTELWRFEYNNDTGQDDEYYREYYEILTNNDYIGEINKEFDAQLIVAAVNACKEINPDNPIAVANELPNLIDFLEVFVYNVTEGMKVVKNGNSIKILKGFLADIHKQK